MNELEIEHRLTETEARSKSNTHRIDRLEPIVNEIHTMSNTMVQLVQEVKHTNETVNSLDEKVDRMDRRVDDMESEPAKRWSNTKEKILTSALSSVITFLVAGIIWAAVQAF